MGYESVFHLIDVKLKAGSLPQLKQARKKRLARDMMEFFLSRAAVDSKGRLQFTASDDVDDPYEPCDGENTVAALSGKWGDAEEIASWLKPHVEKGGRTILHSLEADSDAWGWVFDGRGKMRTLALRSMGKWE